MLVSTHIESASSASSSSNVLNDTNEAQLRSLCSSISSSASDSSSSGNTNNMNSSSASSDSSAELLAIATEKPPVTLNDFDDIIQTVMEDLLTEIEIQIETKRGNSTDYSQQAREIFLKLKSLEFDNDSLSEQLAQVERFLFGNEEEEEEKKFDDDDDSSSLDMSNLDDVLVKYFDFLNDEEDLSATTPNRALLESDLHLLLCIHLSSCVDLVRRAGDLSLEIEILARISETLIRKKSVFRSVDAIFMDTNVELKRTVWGESQRLVVKRERLTENAAMHGLENLKGGEIFQNCVHSHVSVFHFNCLINAINNY
jgi:hypothetical protein